MTDRTAWLLRLHGAPAVGDADQQGWRALERKDAAWLAVLAAEGHCARERLAAWLWPDSAPASAATNLRQRVFRLRKQLGHPLVVTGPSLALADGIAVLPGDYAWLTPFEYDDCPDFQRWLQQGNARRLAACRDRLRGEVDALQAAGRWADALRGIEELLALDALSEVDQRRLMRLHHLRGDRAAAVAAFHRFQAALRTELGTRPDAETMELLRVVESSRQVAIPAPRRAVPVSLLRPPRLVGRDEVLEQCARAWQGGSIVLLHADGGMGKSRLLEELASALGGQALMVGARPGDHEIPYALLSRLLRALDEQGASWLDAQDTAALGALLPGRNPAARPPAVSTLLLQAALAALLSRLAPQVALVLLDDLHLADPASLDLLAAVLGTPSSAAGPGWTLACRDHEGPAALTNLRKALADTQRLRQVPLPGLDERALQQLVGSLGIPYLEAAQLAPRLWQHTGGNPQFVLETLKEHLLAGATCATLPRPPTVGAVIERRLAGLSPMAMLLARVAALTGRTFSVDLAAAVLQMPALALSDAWSELESAHVLRGGSFAHDLVRETVLGAVPAAIAMHQHVAIAQALEGLGATAATLGWHWEQGGDWAKAARSFLAAAREARDLGRREDAAGFLERAVQCFDRAGLSDDAFQAKLNLVAIGQTVLGSERTRELARQLQSAAHTPQQAAAARVHQALVELWAQHHQTALALCEAALAGDHLVDSGLRLHAETLRSVALAGMGRIDEALDNIQQWSAAADAETDADAQLTFIGYWALVLMTANRRRQALDLARRQLQLARQVGHLDTAGTALENLAAAAASLGQLDEALGYAQEADRLAAMAGADAGRRCLSSTTVGRLLYAAGRYREALGRMLPALEELRQLMPGTPWVDNLECCIADTWLALGQPARAEPMLIDRPCDMAQVRAKRLLSRSQFVRLRGLPVSNWLDQAQAAASGPASGLIRMQIELERALDDAPQKALERCAAVREQAVRVDAVLMVLLADARCLPALVTLGRLAEARDLAADVARRALTQQGQMVHPPELLLVAAKALQACGDEAGAAQAMADGAAWVRERAREHVPAEFVESFCHRHPVHRQLLAATAGQAEGRPPDLPAKEPTPRIFGGQ